MEDIERVDVFAKTFLQNYFEKQARRQMYSYVEKDYVDVTQKLLHQMRKKAVRQHDLIKNLQGTVSSLSNTLGFKNIWVEVWILVYSYVHFVKLYE